MWQQETIAYIDISLLLHIRMHSLKEEIIWIEQEKDIQKPLQSQ